MDKKSLVKTRNIYEETPWAKVQLLSSCQNALTVFFCQAQSRCFTSTQQNYSRALDTL